MAAVMRISFVVETFRKLAVNEPGLMWSVLQTSVAALVNTQNAQSVEAEMKVRAVKGN